MSRSNRISRLITAGSGQSISDVWTDFASSITVFSSIAGGTAFTSYTVNKGLYKIVGKAVYLYIYLTVITDGTGSGAGETMYIPIPTGLNINTITSPQPLSCVRINPGAPLNYPNSEIMSCMVYPYSQPSIIVSIPLGTYGGLDACDYYISGYYLVDNPANADGSAGTGAMVAGN